MFEHAGPLGSQAKNQHHTVNVFLAPDRLMQQLTGLPVPSQPKGPVSPVELLVFDLNRRLTEEESEELGTREACCPHGCDPSQL